jgi:hypothetical protein
MITGTIRTSCLISVFFLFAALQLCAQTTGSIVGRVTDSSGATVPAAKVELTNQDTGIANSAEATGQGEFVFPRVDPGKYRLTVSSNGFKTTIKENIDIQVNQTAREDFSLQVGQVSSTVDVTGQAAIVQSETSSVGSVVDNAQIKAMPLNGRTNIFGLMALAPGVQQSGQNPSISGSAFRGGTSSTVDGASNDDTANERLLANVPSLDSISEFKVVSSLAPAEFGKASAVITATKSGTNELHGSLFAFNRNAFLAAKNHGAENLAVPAFNRNEYGGSVGGPVLKNKLFYFGSFEGLRLIQPTTTTLAFPNTTMKTGDFSSLLPATVVKVPGTQTPFAGNMLPSSLISPISQQFLKFMSTPNLAGSGPGGLGSNFVANVPSEQPNDRYSGRADYHISDKDTVFVRYFWTNNGPYSTAGGGVMFDNWDGFGITTKNFAAEYTRILTPSMVNVFDVGLSNWQDYRTPQNHNFDPSTIIPGDPAPLPGLGGLPTISITGFTTLQDQPGSADTNKNDTFSDAFIWNHGKHNLKAGFSFGRLSTVNQQNSTPYRGSFSFDGRYTGNSFADFLIGDLAGSSRTTSNFVLDDLGYRAAAYVQDDWRVTSRLTLNYGLRWDYQSPWEPRNQLATWDSNLNSLVVINGQADPAWNGAVPIVSGSSVGMNASNYMNLGKANFAPRFGSAYRPFNTSRFVIRGGYGIYYVPLSLYDANVDIRDLGLNPPFRATQTFYGSNNGIPNITWNNAFPGVTSVSSNPDVYGVAPNFRLGYEQEWNFALEFEPIKDTAVHVTYLGNKGTHLVQSLDVNQPLPSPLPIQSLRPYQPWGNITYYESDRNQNLNQLQIGATRRFADLQFGVEYQFTRALGPNYQGSEPYDNSNLNLDYGNLGTYVRNYAVINYIYNLPFGKNQKFFSSASPVVDKLISGWQLAGIATLSSGPFASVNFNSTLTGWPSGRANIVGNPTLSNQTQYQWFNAAAFAVPSAYTFGNSASNLIQTPGTHSWDTGIFKQTPLTERLHLEIRMEAFDVLNHGDLGNLATNISLPTQVGISSTRVNSRVLQFGARLSF